MVRYLAQTTPADEVQVRDWTGEAVPVHVTPSGLVMLAFAPEPEVEKVLAEDLPVYTPATVIDAETIRERLADIRATGSVWLVGEFSIEATSVAAPVFGADGTVMAAIHSHGPSYRFPGERSPVVLAGHVRDVADRLTDRLRA
jgi:DNA-binding IclR family transcriptional regulator